MTTYNIISLLFGSGLLVTIFGYVFKMIKANNDKTEAVSLGVQALLRDRLLQSYEYYQNAGYMPIEAKDNFENMWKQYHALGVNGVMDEIHRSIMELPTHREED